MCDTSAFVLADDGEELLLESVDYIRPEGGKVYLRNIFGEERTVEARIKEISLAKHRVVLER
ncbi:MAG: CooT family nickel-binding protein [Thermodesulfovibrionales bacterium]|nr:CooT family nickel-binding protein [Thermodesulfovibrionales bacterium]